MAWVPAESAVEELMPRLLPVEPCDLTEGFDPSVPPKDASGISEESAVSDFAPCEWAGCRAPVYSPGAAPDPWCATVPPLFAFLSFGRSGKFKILLHPTVGR